MLIPNTFHIPAHCPRILSYSSVDELQRLIPTLARPVLHIGAGSNLLFLNDYEGTILHSEIKDLDILSDEGDTVRLSVGGGVVWDEFVATAVGRGWHGAENLSLIPGEVGAAAVQNIGAYGAEVKDLIEEVECIDLRTGERRLFACADCHYGYRQSIFKTPEVRGRYAVTHVTLRLTHTFRPALDYGGLRNLLEDPEHVTPAQLRQTVIDVRRYKLPDPDQLGNAGSFFMNPIIPRVQYEALLSRFPDMPHYDVGEGRVKVPAAYLIEQCGWKGRALGPAAVHKRQALILVNLGGATGQDILRLSDAIRHDVHARFGIDIHPEVNFIF